MRSRTGTSDVPTAHAGQDGQQVLPALGDAGAPPGVRRCVVATVTRSPSRTKRSTNRAAAGARGLGLLPGDAEVVEDDRERAAGAAPAGLVAGHGRRRIRRGLLRRARDEGLEARDLARPPVLLHDEVVARQAGDRPAVAVEDDRVHGDELDAGAGRSAGLLAGGACARAVPGGAAEETREQEEAARRDRASRRRVGHRSSVPEKRTGCEPGGPQPARRGPRPQNVSLMPNCACLGSRVADAWPKPSGSV